MLHFRRYHVYYNTFEHRYTRYSNSSLSIKPWLVFYIEPTPRSRVNLCHYACAMRVSTSFCCIVRACVVIVSYNSLSLAPLLYIFFMSTMYVSRSCAHYDIWHSNMLPRFITLTLFFFARSQCYHIITVHAFVVYLSSQNNHHRHYRHYCHHAIVVAWMDCPTSGCW